MTDPLDEYLERYYPNASPRERLRMVVEATVDSKARQYGANSEDAYLAVACVAEKLARRISEEALPDVER